MKKVEFGWLFLTISALLVAVSCTPNDKHENIVLGQHYTDGREVELVDDIDLSGVTFKSGIFNNYNYPANVNGNVDYTGEVADPHVVRGDDGYFYIFASGKNVLRSEDGSLWEKYDCQFINKDNDPSKPFGVWWANDYAMQKYGNCDGLGIWAPDVMHVKDKWIYYYSISDWGEPVGIGLAVSDNPGGPYEDYGKLFIGEDIGVNNCIDPCMFKENGQMYLIMGSFQGVFLVELEEDGLSLKNGTTYEEATEYWKTNKILLAGYDGPFDQSTYEGSYLTKKGDYYYLFVSTGECCKKEKSTYQVMVARSKDIKGPYLDASNNKLTDAGRTIVYGELVVWSSVKNRDTLVGPGHNSILVDDAGDWWIYYHSYVSRDNFKTRHLFMDKLVWGDNGFPYVGETLGSSKCQPSYNEELTGPRFI